MQATPAAKSSQKLWNMQQRNKSHSPVMMGLTKNDSDCDGIESENKDDDEQAIIGKQTPKQHKTDPEIDGGFTAKKSTVNTRKRPENQKELID